MNRQNNSSTYTYLHIRVQRCNDRRRFIPIIRGFVHHGQGHDPLVFLCTHQGHPLGVAADHPDLADRLVEQGIDSMSLNPDTVVSTWMRLASRKPA